MCHIVVVLVQDHARQVGTTPTSRSMGCTNEGYDMEPRVPLVFFRLTHGLQIVETIFADQRRARQIELSAKHEQFRHARINEPSGVGS
jgi:hypothetical protein